MLSYYKNLLIFIAQFGEIIVDFDYVANEQRRSYSNEYRGE